MSFDVSGIPVPNLTKPTKEVPKYSCGECGNGHERVTKIIGKSIVKDAIPFWSEKIGRESMFTVLKDNPDLSFDDAKTLIKKSGLDTKGQSEVAMDRGSQIHNWLEMVGNGVECNEPPFEGYVEQAKRFLDDFQVETLKTEFQVANCDMQFAGTVDGIARIGKQPPRRNRQYDLTGKLVLFDWKTNKAGRTYVPSHSLQLQCYLQALQWSLEHRVDGPTQQGPELGLLVGIGEESYSTRVVEADGAAVKALLDFYRVIV